MENKHRNIALDILRGMSIVIMILVDAVPDFGAAPPILLHSPWEGITVADLAFPGFVFAMGASAAFSMRRRPREAWTKKILLRTLLLCVLGLLLNLLPALFALLLDEGYAVSMFYDEVVAHGRWLGILQRLALTYALGMLLALWLKENLRLLFTAMFLLGISSLGYHLYAPEAPFSQMHNISQAVDLIFPGEDHAYPFYGLPFDPEGLYGTIASTATMIFGLLAGRVLQGSAFLHQKVLVLSGGGISLMLLGWFWCKFDIIGKPLWTSPYALLNAGGDMLTLALLLWLLETFPKASRVFRPFYAFGRNPLFFFLASNAALMFLSALPTSEGIPAYQWLWQHTVKDMADLPVGITLYTILWCLLWWPLAEFFCYRNIIFKL